ncbi:hypothetical protein HERIO_1179 [Hepatospora eriocheir]|uniref:Uncharacterized protein n=1 Tax=Hepatospora eriocheir TaxID=1081669 RepID=A0A1X0QAU2_9MICR|nr:hypothetical protein HERIO_1179 [Hepatospora eriocheir]
MKVNSVIPIQIFDITSKEVKKGYVKDFFYSEIIKLNESTYESPKDLIKSLEDHSDCELVILIVKDNMSNEDKLEMIKNMSQFQGILFLNYIYVTMLGSGYLNGHVLTFDNKKYNLYQIKDNSIEKETLNNISESIDRIFIMRKTLPKNSSIVIVDIKDTELIKNYIRDNYVTFPEELLIFDLENDLKFTGTSVLGTINKLLTIFNVQSDLKFKDKIFDIKKINKSNLLYLDSGDPKSLALLFLT